MHKSICCILRYGLVNSEANLNLIVKRAKVFIKV